MMNRILRDIRSLNAARYRIAAAIEQSPRARAQDRGCTAASKANTRSREYPRRTNGPRWPAYNPARPRAARPNAMRPAARGCNRLRVLTDREWTVACPPGFDGGRRYRRGCLFPHRPFAQASGRALSAMAWRMRKQRIRKAQRARAADAVLNNKQRFHPDNHRINMRPNRHRRIIAPAFAEIPDLLGQITGWLTRQARKIIIVRSFALLTVAYGARFDARGHRIRRLRLRRACLSRAEGAERDSAAEREIREQRAEQACCKASGLHPEIGEIKEMCFIQNIVTVLLNT